MKKLTEADFAALRGPFESGRQSPSGLSWALLLSVILHPLTFILVYMTVGYHTNFPYKDILFYAHMVVTSIVVVLSIIYSIPYVYIRGQKLQYLLTIIVSQLMLSVNFMLGALFIIGSPDSMFLIDEAGIAKILLITILMGMLWFAVVSIRFYKLLQKGEYRKESGRDIWRSKMEKKQLIVPAIILGTSLVLIIQSVDIEYRGFDGDLITILTIGPILYFTMIFVLPEQLVLLYCKIRFKSFNYDMEGNLIESSNEGVEKNEH